MALLNSCHVEVPLELLVGIKIPGSLKEVKYRKKLNTAIRDIYKRYDSFVQRGSGWVLKKLSKFSVSIMKF